MDRRKLALLLLKAVPVVGALSCVLNSMLSYIGIYLDWLGYATISFFIIAWYLLARIFNFCTFYFILLFYVLSCEALNMADYYIGIPVSDRGMFVLHVSLFGLYALIYTFIHVRDTRKLKEHLKETG